MKKGINADIHGGCRGKQVRRPGAVRANRQFNRLEGLASLTHVCSLSCNHQSEATRNVCMTGLAIFMKSPFCIGAQRLHQNGKASVEILTIAYPLSASLSARGLAISSISFLHRKYLFFLTRKILFLIDARNLHALTYFHRPPPVAVAR